MKSNPILEETWKVKDALAQEAGNDITRLCEQTRAWAASHRHPGPLIHNAAELREFFRVTEAPQAIIAEDPPKK